MVWKVHQPKLGRYYPPAPLKHFFVFLPVRPSGLQERRASFACGEVRLPPWCALQHHLDDETATEIGKPALPLQRGDHQRH